MLDQGYSPNVEEYLEELYRFHERGEEPVATGALAEKLGIKAPSVTEMLGTLAEEGLVEYEPYKGAYLTERGREEGRKVLEKHRVIERLLTDVLGLDWSEVHEEACRLEHTVSEDLKEKILEVLEDPERCPHGKPLTEEGHGDVPLGELEGGDSAVVVSVSDEDSETLREIASLSIEPGKELDVLSSDDGHQVVELEGEELDLDDDVSCAVRVEPV